MGNATCCASETKSLSFNYIGMEIAKSIERNDIKQLSNLIHLLPSMNLTIDSEIIIIKNISLSPLCYSVFTGKKKVFKYLYDKTNDLSRMDNILMSLNLTAIDIICERGYLELLEFYLPIYLSIEKTSPKNTEFAEITLNLTSNPDIPTTIYSTPIQKACEKGHIAIIMHLYNYFKNKNPFPVFLI